MASDSYVMDLLEEETDEFERELESQSRQENELRAQAVLGDDLQTFLRSELGRELWKRAERDRIAVALQMLKLEVDTPDFKEQFLALKAKDMGGEKFMEYCTRIEAEGDVALRKLMEKD